MTKLKTIDAIRTSTQAIKRYVDSKDVYYDASSEGMRFIDGSSVTDNSGESYSYYEIDTLGLKSNVEYKINVTVDNVTYHGVFVPKDGGSSIGATNFAEDSVFEIFFDVSGTAITPYCINYMGVYDTTNKDWEYDETKAVIQFRLGEHADGTKEVINSIEIQETITQTVPLTTELLKEHRLLSNAEKDKLLTKTEGIIYYAQDIRVGDPTNPGINIEDVVYREESQEYVQKFNYNFGILYAHVYKATVLLSNWKTVDVYSDEVWDDYRPTAFFTFTNPLTGNEVSFAFRDKSSPDSIVAFDEAYFEIDDISEIQWIDIVCVKQQLTTQYMEEAGLKFATSEEKEKWNKKADKDYVDGFIDSGQINISCIDGYSANILAAHSPSDGFNTIYYSTKAYISSSGSIGTEANMNAKAFYEDGTSLANKYAIKEYVDETIETINTTKQNKEDDSLNTTNKTISGAINELNDLIPCYDTRGTETITYEYDKIEEGKVTAYEYYEGKEVQRFVKVADLTAEEFDIYAEKMKSSYDSESSFTQELEQTLGDSVYDSTYEGNSFATFEDADENKVNTILYANACVYFIKQPYSNSYIEFPEAGVYFQTYCEWNTKYPIKMTINVVNGELKVIDKKYLVNSPGRTFDPYSIEYYDSDIKTTFTYRSGEVFNNESNMALEFDSHAEGKETKALGNYSHTEGYKTLASGEASHAEGSGTKARGKYSHAEGFSSHALAQAAHAEGESTTANSLASHAEGVNTIASGYGQHVQGKFNIEDEYNYAHIVGNGDYDARSNAYTLDWDGNAWFAGDVFIKGTSQNDGQKLITNAELENIATMTQDEFDLMVSEVFGEIQE